MICAGLTGVCGASGGGRIKYKSETSFSTRGNSVRWKRTGCYGILYSARERVLGGKSITYGKKTAPGFPGKPLDEISMQKVSVC